jgi:predicted nucleic acid-binding protein
MKRRLPGQALRDLPALPPSHSYGEIFRQLKAEGRMIGANDLWIAATARAHGMPVVTNSLQEFQRVEGLEVLPF